MRNKLGSFFMVIGIMLLIGAIALFGYNKWEDHQAKIAAEQILAQLHEMNDTVSDIVPDPYGEMTVKTIDGNDYVGYIAVPSLGIELPVMAEWDYSKLKLSPCRYYGSTKSDDIVIAAHNYTSHFGPLRNIHTGDTVTFTDMDNITTEYEVVEIEQLNATDVLPMQESGYDLSLFTCTLGGKFRTTVRCNRTAK